MATRLKKSRAAYRNVLKGFVVKVREIVQDGLDEEKRQEIDNLLKAIELKRKVIADLDDKILEVIEEDKIDEEVDTTSTFELKMIGDLSEIDKLTRVKEEPNNARADAAAAAAAVAAATAAAAKVVPVPAVKSSRPKPPPLQIKKFSGDPTAWQQFIDIFDALIDVRDDFSNVEKFGHLRGYLSGDAEKCIAGLSLTNDNYPIAINLLKKRYDNKQLIIWAHMKKLLKIETVSSEKHHKELRNLHDVVEGNVRSLATNGIAKDAYGPLLMPVIHERLPEEVQLNLNQKLGTATWQIDEYMKVLEEDITARETCVLMQDKSSATSKRKGGNGEKGGGGDGHFTTESLFAGLKERVCAFCSKNHFHDKCTIVTDLKQRRDIIKNKRLCFRCLSTGHAIRNCRYRRDCFTCGSKRHHTAICEPSQTPPPGKDENGEKQQATLVSSKTSVLLQTAEADISDTSEKKKSRIRILLDSGSQRTYVTDRLARKLNWTPVESKRVTINAFGDTAGKEGVYNMYKFCVKNPKRGISLYMSGYSVPHICSPLTGQAIDNVEELFPCLKNLDLNDTSGGAGEIDLLVGADYYWSVVGGRVKRCGDDGLMAIDTKLGWVLSGPCDKNGDAQSSNAMVTHSMFVTSQPCDATIDTKLEELVEKMWDLETMGIKENETPLYEKLADTVKFVNGRYEVHLPFKESRPFIEDNYAICEKRLLNLKKRLDKNEKQLFKYDEIMKDQMKKGVIEDAESEPEAGAVTYFPHRAVIRADKDTTDFRVVYDASVSNKGPSLNDCMYKGPTLSPLLFDVLLRFRVSNIGVTADIEKAYLQISVAPSDRDYLRLLWFDDVRKEHPSIVKRRFARVIFGARPSQFLLNGVIKFHAEKYSRIDPQFVEKILRSFYIDDLNSGVKTSSEGKEFYKKARLRFWEASFNLRKWRTNDEELRKYINEQEAAENNIIAETGGKVLGLKWNEVKDQFEMSLATVAEEATQILPTRRNVLKIIASIYDPLGFFQPVVISLKILFQAVCSSGVKWDEVINEDLKSEWNILIERIKNMTVLVIPRCYCLSDCSDPVVKVELHGFSDASESAYACCVYLKCIKESGAIKVSFVAAKSRLVPAKKKLSIPKLELFGNLLVCRLVVNVYRALQTEISIHQISCWTDSKVSLAWIKSSEKEFDTIVQNRVSEIRKAVDINDWYFCRTEVNPADIITRSGGDPNSEMFQLGPDFLRQPSINFENDFKLTEATEHPDFVNSVIVIADATDTPGISTTHESSCLIGNFIDIARYNDYLKLLRVTGYVFRYVTNLTNIVRKKPLNLNKWLTSVDINGARFWWIIDNQASIKKDSNFVQLQRNLHLLKDDVGVLRSFSRMINAKIPFDTKAPVYINRDHRLAEVIVYYCHTKVLHRGIKQTLTEMRTRFWIAKGRSFIRKLLRPCGVCKKLNVRGYEYPSFSNLPDIRFEDSHAFRSTGVDYLGPLLCLPVFGANDNMYKTHVSLFTCTATRAIYLEVVHDASAETFVNCFKRFIAGRGCPAKMISDKGSVFNAKVTQSYAAELGVKWKFNLDTASWFGGIWERLVASVKRCMKKVIGTKKLTYVELQTLVKEVEFILNNRPIGIDYEDDYEDVLTPNHLVFGRRLEATNDVEDSLLAKEGLDNPTLVKRKRVLETMLNHFWKRWRKEYLTSLRESLKISKQRKSAKPQVGDVVIVYDEKLPRHVWRLGKIETLIAGGDGCIRGAEVKLGKTGVIIKRPVNKLYPIVTADNVNGDSSVTPNIPTTTSRSSPTTVDSADNSRIDPITVDDVSADNSRIDPITVDDVSADNSRIDPTTVGDVPADDIDDDSDDELHDSPNDANRRPRRAAAIKGEQRRKLNMKTN